MEMGEVPKGIRWSTKAGGPPKVRISGVSGRGQGPTREPGLNRAPVVDFSNCISCL